MTPEEREAKLSLVGAHAKRLNQHLDLSKQMREGMTDAVRRARAEVGAAPLPCDAPHSVQKSVDPEALQALRADVKAAAKSLLGVVRTLKSTRPESKSEVVTGCGYFVR